MIKSYLKAQLALMQRASRPVLGEVASSNAVELLLSVLSVGGRLRINGGCAKDALIATEKDHSGGFYRPSR
jgi:hypothetical protein